MNRVLDYAVDSMTVLGKGAMGIVHPAMDKKGNKVVVKCIDYTDESKQDQILADLENISKLDHKNIVRVLDTEEKDMVVWIFMEFCPLGDLEKYFRAKDREDRENVQIILGIAKGVEYLHNQNVIH